MPRPTRGDQLIGPYAKPKVRGSGCAFQPGTLELKPNQFIPLDTPAWFAWLDQELAFRFKQVYYVAGLSLAEAVYLSYTVRPAANGVRFIGIPTKSTTTGGCGAPIWARPETLLWPTSTNWPCNSWPKSTRSFTRRCVRLAWFVSAKYHHLIPTRKYDIAR